MERVLLDSVLDVSGSDPLYLDIFGAVPRVLRAICRQRLPELHRATRWPTSPGSCGGWPRADRCAGA